MAWKDLFVKQDSKARYDARIKEVSEKWEKEILPHLGNLDAPQPKEAWEGIFKENPPISWPFVQEKIRKAPRETILQLAPWFLKMQSSKHLHRFIEHCQPQDKKDRLWIFLLSILMQEPQAPLRSIIACKLTPGQGEKTAQAILELIEGKKPEIPSQTTLIKGPAALALLPILEKYTHDKEEEMAQSVLLCMGTIEEAPEIILPKLIDSLHSHRASLCKAGANALILIGEKAVPSLKEALSDPESRVRVSAAWALGKIGKPAKEAAPELVESLFDSDPKVRKPAAKALENIGREIVPLVLEKAQGSEDLELLLFTAKLLQQFGVETVEEITFLLPLAKHPDDDLRKTAISALGASKIFEATKIFIEALSDKEEICLAAIAALENLHFPIPKAIAPLCALFHHDSPSIAKAAALALLEVGGKEEKTLDALGEILHSPDLTIQEAAITGLTAFEDSARKFLPALIQKAKENKENARLRLLFLTAFLQIGDPEGKTIPFCLESLFSSEAGIREKAGEVLGKIGTKALPYLVSAIPEADALVRSEITKALIQIGPDAVPALIRTLEGTDAAIRKVASDALGGLGAKAIYALKDFLHQSSDFWVEKAVAHAWEKNGKAAIPILIDIIRKQDDFTASTLAIEVLKKMKQKSLPQLLCLLTDPVPQLSQLAVSALKRIHEDYYEAIPELVDLGDHENPMVRQAVAWCLGEIGRAEPSVLELLLSLQKDPHPLVREAASQAKEKLAHPGSKHPGRGDVT